MRRARMIAFNDGFRLLAVVFLLLTPLVFLMRKPQHHDGPAAVVGD